MTNSSDPEQLAAQLEHFFTAAARVPKPRFQAAPCGVQAAVSSSGNGVGDRPRQEVLADCVAALSKDDRDQLDRLLVAMRQTIEGL
jgi:hypothetical protein